MNDALSASREMTLRGQLFATADQHDDPHVRSLGSYRQLEVDIGLDFPEPNQAKMVNWQHTLIEVVTPVRFLLRGYSWRGHGSHRPPTVVAELDDGSPLRARVHGDLFRDDNGRSYLVDLGKRLEPGTRFKLSTESVFVDELGTFKPFFAFTAISDQLMRLSQSVAFARPPEQVEYHFKPIGGDWEDLGHVESERAGELMRYAACKDIRPSRAGVHKLTW